MIVASDKYKCSNEIISIATILSIGSSIFDGPKGDKVHADNARSGFSRGDVGDHMALLKLCWQILSICMYLKTMISLLIVGVFIMLYRCTMVEKNPIFLKTSAKNYIKTSCMERARSIRIQLDNMLPRVDIKATSNAGNSEAIMKVVPSRLVVCNKLVRTRKEEDYMLMLHVSEIETKWLQEIASHYYHAKDFDEVSVKKMPRGVGRATRIDPEEEMSFDRLAVLHTLC
ncbi:putative RNA helicase [Helianthus debilis subsp. tardiflorus]